MNSRILHRCDAPGGVSSRSFQDDECLLPIVDKIAIKAIMIVPVVLSVVIVAPMTVPWSKLIQNPRLTKRASTSDMAKSKRSDPVQCERQSKRVRDSE
jgi:hypothetical protein